MHKSVWISPHDITVKAGVVYPSLKTTVDDIEESDSRRANNCLHAFTILQAVIKTIVKNNEWTDSMNVDCVPFRVICQILSYCRLTMNGLTVGGF